MVLWSMAVWEMNILFPPPLSMIPASHIAKLVRHTKKGGTDESSVGAWSICFVSKSPSTFSSCDYLPAWTSSRKLDRVSSFFTPLTLKCQEWRQAESRARLQIWPFSRNPLEKDGNFTAIQSTWYGSCKSHLNLLTVANRWGFVKAFLGCSKAEPREGRSMGCQT